MNCPFCNEPDFDAPGLKLHLSCGNCEKYNDIPMPHYHDAMYVDGVLSRECGRCGRDLAHESHVRRAAE